MNIQQLSFRNVLYIGAVDGTCIGHTFRTNSTRKPHFLHDELILTALVAKRLGQRAAVCFTYGERRIITIYILIDYRVDLSVLIVIIVQEGELNGFYNLTRSSTVAFETLLYNDYHRTKKESTKKET